MITAVLAENASPTACGNDVGMNLDIDIIPGTITRSVCLLAIFRRLLINVSSVHSTMGSKRLTDGNELRKTNTRIL